MNDKDLKATLEAMDKLSKEVTKSPEKARAFLVAAGFVNKNGELNENYR